MFAAGNSRTPAFLNPEKYVTGLAIVNWATWNASVMEIHTNIPNTLASLRRNNQPVDALFRYHSIVLASAMALLWVPGVHETSVSKTE